jgi:hypothetical protein
MSDEIIDPETGRPSQTLKDWESSRPSHKQIEEFIVKNIAHHDPPEPFQLKTSESPPLSDRSADRAQSRSPQEQDIASSPATTAFV